jgi:hypothetical protein
VRARLALGGLLVLSAALHLWLIDRWQSASVSTAPTLVPTVRPVDLRPLPAPAPTSALAQVAVTPPAPRAPAAPVPTALPARSASPATDPQADAASARTMLAPTAETLTVAIKPPGPAPETAPVMPPPVRLDYRLSRGALVGRGQIDWDLDGSRYRMRLEARVPVIGLILTQTSTGHIDAQGIAPERHTDQRLRRSERAVSFVREGASPHVSFSGREGREPLEPGTQDRLSWIAQLTARLDAPGLTPGAHLVMPVASTGGEVQHWVFTLIERDEAGRWHLRREPEGPFDTRAEVWTLPQAPHWPQRLRLSEADGDALELLLLAS